MSTDTPKVWPYPWPRLDRPENQSSRTNLGGVPVQTGPPIIAGRLDALHNEIQTQNAIFASELQSLGEEVKKVKNGLHDAQSQLARVDALWTIVEKQAEELRALQQTMKVTVSTLALLSRGMSSLEKRTEDLEDEVADLVDSPAPM